MPIMSYWVPCLQSKENYSQLLAELEENGVEAAEKLFLAEKEKAPESSNDLLHTSVREVLLSFGNEVTSRIELTCMLSKHIDITSKNICGDRPVDLLLNRPTKHVLHRDKLVMCLLNKELLDKEFTRENCSYLGALIRVQWWGCVEWALAMGASVKHVEGIKYSPLAMLVKDYRFDLHNFYTFPEMHLVKRLMDSSTINRQLCICGATPLHLGAEMPAFRETLFSKGADKTALNGYDEYPVDSFILHIDSAHITNTNPIIELAAHHGGISCVSALLVFLKWSYWNITPVIQPN